MMFSRFVDSRDWCFGARGFPEVEGKKCCDKFRFAGEERDNELTQKELKVTTTLLGANKPPPKVCFPIESGLSSIASHVLPEGSRNYLPKITDHQQNSAPQHQPHEPLEPDGHPRIWMVPLGNTRRPTIGSPYVVFLGLFNVNTKMLRQAGSDSAIGPWAKRNASLSQGKTDPIGKRRDACWSSVLIRRVVFKGRHVLCEVAPLWKLRWHPQKREVWFRWILFFLTLR